MQTKERNLSDLKFNLDTWKRELRFHFNEMDTFQEKLEEIAVREFGRDARKDLEMFQNRIMIEKAAISKLMHQCKERMKDINNVALNGQERGSETELRSDMRTYIKLHYDLKEEMMDFFTSYLSN